MKHLTQRVEGTMHRQVDLRAVGTVDKENRTVRLSISSETPVLRSSFFSAPWVETLGHKRGEVDLGRLTNGATVHYNHSRKREDRIGVVESATVNDNRVEAVVRFSKSERVNDVWDDVRDGVLRNVSVGYRINERKLTREGADGGPDEFRVTSWTPMEVSFVDIPADPSVGVGRDHGGNLAYRVIDIQPGTNEGNQTMSDRNDGDGNVTQLPANNPALLAEQQRRQAVDQVFAHILDTPGMDEVRNACKDDMTCNVEQAGQRALEFMGRNSSPAGGDAYRPGEFCDDAHFSMPYRGDEFTAACSDAILQRANIRVENPHPGAKDVAGSSLVDMARMCLGRNGINAGGMPKGQMLERAFTTSDYPLILQNAVSKSVINGFNEAPATHMGITRETFAPDFKTTFRVAASEAPDLLLVNEDGEYKYGGVSETGASVALLTYGRLQAISRQTIVNDDLGEILRALRSAGTAASRLESDVVWGLITSNVVMPDGDPLFDANHNNISTAAALSVASLGDMRKLLRLQKGIAGLALLDLQPHALVVPAALETVAEQLLASLADPAGVNQQTFNPFAHKLRLIVEPRLDADSATRYYLITQAEVFNWFDRVHLEGNGGVPLVLEQEGWSIDGLEVKVAHDFAALVNDFRGAVKNDGV